MGIKRENMFWASSPPVIANGVKQQGETEGVKILKDTHPDPPWKTGRE